MSEDDKLADPVQLTAEQKKKIDEWMGKFADECPVCKKSEGWSIFDGLVSPILLKGKRPWLGAVVPFFVITCKSCGCSQYVNAFFAGIAGADTPRESDE